MENPKVLAYYLPQFHPIPEKRRQELSNLGHASQLHHINKHLSAVERLSKDYSLTIMDGRTMVERWSNASNSSPASRCYIASDYGRF